MEEKIKNRLMEDFKNGRKTVGIFTELGCPYAVEALKGTGLDFVILDGEHGQSDTESLISMIRACEVTGLSSLVRVAEVTHKEIQRVMDSGPSGIIVPYLRTMDEIRKLVELSKYSPVGNRGFAPVRGTFWGNAPEYSGTVAETMAKLNKETLVIPQCETKELLSVIDEVVSEEGIDGIFIGPYDLSISLGVPGEFNSEIFLSALDKIISSVRKSGKILLIYANTPEEARSHFENGIDGAALSMDAIYLNRAVRNMVSDVRA